MLEKSIIKHITKLHQKKYRKETGEFLIEGIKGVEEAINSGAKVILIIIEGTRRDEKSMDKLIQLADTNSVQIEYCGRSDIGDIKSTSTFPGVLAVIEEKYVELEDLLGTKESVVALDRISDPGNLGTVIRTCDWFGIKNILLSEGCVDPHNEKVVRSTMGSIFRENVYVSTNIIQDLEVFKKQGYKIVTLDMEGKDIEKLKHTDKTIYVFGNESHGISTELKKMVDEVYTIPGKGVAESLNLGVSVGITLSKIK